MLATLATLTTCATTTPPTVIVLDAPMPSGAPQLGAHALAFHRLYAGKSPIAIAPIATQKSGSVILASVGRGDIKGFALPTDDKGNPFEQLGATHAYTRWATSGTALYAVKNAAGGSGHVIAATTPPDDEVTLAAVEITNAHAIQDAQWREVTGGPTVTSASVTTTAPAVLVAFWWGDGGADDDKTATPSPEFKVIDSILLEGSLVQCAVAVREVPVAGTYSVTWTSSPAQGAQMWLVAVQ